MAHLTRQCCAYCGGNYMRHFPNAPGSTVDFCTTFQTPVGRKICLDKPSDHWPVQPRERFNRLDSPPSTEYGLYDRFMAASKLLPDFKSAEPVTIDLHSALYVRITFWNNSNVPELVLPSQNFSRVAYLAFEHIRTHHDENIRRREVEIRSMDGQIVRTIAPGMRLMAAIKKDIHINDSPGGGHPLLPLGRGWGDYPNAAPEALWHNRPRRRRYELLASRSQQPDSRLHLRQIGDICSPG